MKREHNVFEILSVLEKNNKPLTSNEIKAELVDIGIRLTDRMIRNYLQKFDKQGFTQPFGKEGRKITEKGRDELKTSFIYAHSDFVFDLIARMVTDTRFDLNRQRGELIVSLVMIKGSKEDKVMEILGEICQSGLLSPLVKTAHSGERLCNRVVPEGMFGLAVLSTATVMDQILVNNGVFMHFGNSTILEVKNWNPVKCTKFVSGSGVSFDPWEMFIRHKYVQVYDCVTKGGGSVLAEYCEIPYTARARVISLLRKTVDIIGGIVVVGSYGDNLLGVPTRAGYCGLVLVGSESIFAALEEKGIKTNYSTLLSAINFKELEPIAPVRGEVILL
ncbi:MAG: DUF128 domain-containing protein [Candidatus Altiarchaeota archaeon]|nr:DUF128 domain-containing protein [Candidatus Altiarchaeota archaeon]